MVAKRVKYTKLGNRIMELARTQREIGKVLGRTQQTISEKLQGRTAILVSDLERIGRHYRVPVRWSFEKE